MALLIINADDYGLCDSVNRGIIECLEAGAVSDLSFIVNASEFNRSAELLKTIDKTDIGFHLNFTAGQSVLGSQSGLVDNDGNYYDLKTFMIKLWRNKITSTDIYREIRSQIEFLTHHQFQITHIDSHRNIHLIPTIMRALLQIRRDLKMNVPIRMPYEGINSIFNLTPLNMVRITMLNVLTMYCYLRTKYKWNILTIGGNFFNNPRPSLVLNKIKTTMRKKPNRVFELAVHPGYPSEKLLEYDEYYQQRLTELNVLKMEYFRTISDRKKICSFSDIEG
jgi:predicted glycoside hydrolase/deacetylase ChbG (UPF0249 family)